VRAVPRWGIVTLWGYGSAGMAGEQVPEQAGGQVPEASGKASLDCPDWRGR